MPDMNGLEMLRRIRREYPQLRVIMFSTLTERGAAITLEALTLGADDYVAKVSNEGSLDRSMARLRDEMIPKIKQFFRVAGQKRGRSQASVRHMRAAAAPAAGRTADRAGSEIAAQSGGDWSFHWGAYRAGRDSAIVPCRAFRCRFCWCSICHLSLRGCLPSA